MGLRALKWIGLLIIEQKMVLSESFSNNKLAESGWFQVNAGSTRPYQVVYRGSSSIVQFE